LDSVGTRLGQAQVAFDDARSKLVTGHRSVIKRAEQLKELGVKPTKQLPLFLADEEAEAANDAATDAPELAASNEG
jgi:DNA recombination protein RmuC